MKKALYIIWAAIIVFCPLAYLLESESIVTADRLSGLHCVPITQESAPRLSAWDRKLAIASKIRTLAPSTTISHIEIATCIVDLSDKYSLDPDLVLAVMAVESGFKPSIISSTKDYGLMQINSLWWHDELLRQGIINKPGDLLTVENNIEAGCYVLAHYLRTRGPRDAVSAYNGYKQGYAEKVFKVYSEII